MDTGHNLRRDGTDMTEAPIAALFVARGGAYFGLDGVDPWDVGRDARAYAGPHAVVAHPPCQRWGRFWHGSTRKPHQFKLGDDDGCFASALAAVRRWGGVLEHPAHSKAWDAFGLRKPDPEATWLPCGERDWTCYVEQGFYGHLSRKPTWLYASGIVPCALRWGRGEQRIHPRALELHGYEKARRIGMMAMVGGKDKTLIRNATPPEFRDVLIAIARSVSSPGPLAGAPGSLPVPLARLPSSGGVALTGREDRVSVDDGNVRGASRHVQEHERGTAPCVSGARTS